MKRTERHHLKENELAHGLVAARDLIETRRRQIAMGVGLLVIVAVVIAAIVFIRGRSTAEAERMLAEGLVALNARVVPSTDPENDDLPAAATLGAEGTFTTEKAKLEAALPKLQAPVDAHPDKEAGITARYHLAGALASLGRHDEAIKHFQDVIARAGDDNLYGQMARLGLADTQMKAGQLDQAIASWKELASRNDETLPEDAILMELARAYVAKGNTEEARKTFTELVDEHPDSPYVAEARTELEALKG